MKKYLYLLMIGIDMCLEPHNKQQNPMQSLSGTSST